jgi:hypothetical protein
MSEELARLDRRGMLRKGAVAAGVAAGAMVITAVGAPKADAAVGDPVTVGGDHTSPGEETTFRITDSTSVAAVGLINDEGPSLSLSPLQTELVDPLAPGQIANTEDGPLIGVVDPDGFPITSYLATGVDLDALPLPVAVAPTRILDTRTASGRGQIVQTSPSAFDSSFRLRGGAWLDVAVDTAADAFTLQAAFLSVTVTGSLRGGFVTAYPPGTRPNASTLNYVRAQTVANGAFVRLGVVDETFVARLYTSGTTHLVVDLTGVAITAEPGPAAVAPTRQGRRSTSRRIYAADRKTRTMRRAALRF